MSPTAVPTRPLQLRRTVLPAAMPSWAATAADLSRDAKAALGTLTKRVPAAKTLASDAKAVPAFPKVTKAGLVAGGQYGEGALIRHGKVVAYCSTAGASYRLQAGAQTFGCAMFFMNEDALAQLGRNEGFEVGVGPSVVALDEGRAKRVTTTTARDDIHAFIFGRKGLMAGVGAQGNKITRIHPK